MKICFLNEIGGSSSSSSSSSSDLGVSSADDLSVVHAKYKLHGVEYEDKFDLSFWQNLHEEILRKLNKK